MISDICKIGHYCRRGSRLRVVFVLMAWMVLRLMPLTSLLLTGLAVYMLSLPSFQACAADVAAAEPRTPHDSLYRMLQEIDVVALKQQRDLTRMAVSGTVIGEAQIERENISDIKGISGMTPNLYIPDYGSRITSSIYVRGIGARMDQPAVGLTVDNVGVLNKDAYDLQLTDIASIEMVRGPQSSLFGRNTMTGLISIRTISPVMFQGWRIGGSLSSGTNVKLNAGWYHMFTGKTGLGVSMGLSRSSGRFVNLHDGQKIDRERSGSLRLRLHWSPEKRVTVSNVLSGSLLRQGGYPYESATTGRIEYDDTCYYRRFLLTDGLTVSARIGRYELMSVTSLQYIDDNMTLDQDFLPVPYFTLTQEKRETSLTEDIMLRGREWQGRYRWLAGVYAFYRHNNMHAPVTFKQVGISQLIESHRNEVNPYAPIRWDDEAFTLYSTFKMPSGGIAAYHESELKLGAWHLTAGVRLDFERINLDYHSYCNTGYTIYNNPGGELPIPAAATPQRDVDVSLDETGRLHREYLMFLPKISALYDLPGGRHNLYASIGRGYKAGGFNTQMFSDVLQQKLMGFMGLSESYDTDDIVGYKPEHSWTYEVGGHFRMPSASLTADVSLFYIDCRNQQLTTFPPGTTTGRLMTNAGRTASFGGELSLRWWPFRGFSLTGSYGYTHARFVKYDNGREDFKDKRVPYAPSNTIFGSAVYDWHPSWMRDNTLQFGVSCNAIGDIYWNEQNTRRQPLYALLNATVAFVASTWRIELWGNNLTDTRYHTFYFLSMGNEFYQRGLPTTLGITASVTL